MTWADESSAARKRIETEVDKFQWAARIHLQCLESVIKAHLQFPASDLRALVRGAIQVYIQPDEEYGAPPDLFSESFHEAIFGAPNRATSVPVVKEDLSGKWLDTEPRRDYKITLESYGEIMCNAVSADLAIRGAIEYALSTSKELGTDAYVIEFLRLKTTATVEQVN